ILGGVSFYFAGLLTGVRSARWFGSRALGIVAAVLGAGLLVVAAEPWEALLIVAGLCLLLGAAGWGSFIAGGAYSPERRVARFALAITLWIGITVCAAVPMGYLLLLPGSGYANNGTWTQYFIDKRGQVIRVTETWDGAIVRITDLDGKPIERLAGLKTGV